MNKLLQHLFYLANADNYPSKKSVFYPLKAELLERYGVSDGWDVQVLCKRCSECRGLGCIDCWDGWDGSWDGYEDCQYCDDGYYVERVRLDRYLLGDRTYHLPNGLIGACEEGFKSRIDGYISHDGVFVRQGAIACQILLLCYRPHSFFGCLKRNLGWWIVRQRRLTREKFERVEDDAPF